MATSPYFNNYGSIAEQRVIEDLIVESIKVMGFDAFYLPNNNDAARDLLYGEDPVKKFNSSFPVEMYLSNIMNYGGEQDFFSKFGLEIKDQVNVLVSRRSFNQRTPQNILTRPREGDLVWIPFLNGFGELYEIKFVEQAKDFAMLGRKYPYFYELYLEKFRYSQEVIDTGQPDIDDVVTKSAYTLTLNTGAGTGTYTLGEYVYQSSANIQTATSIATIQSWTPSANTLTVTNIKGEFTVGSTLKGNTSNAQYVLSSYDVLEDPAIEENYDNKFIYDSANSVVDLSESNPFGLL
jgi:hypothetical protein